MSSIDSWNKKILECYKKALIVAKIEFKTDWLDEESFLKLRVLFIQYPKFLTYRFFYAPIFLERLQKVKNQYDLKYYCLQNSVKNYIDYMNFLDENDVEYSINYIKESFLFIRDFCKLKSINTRQYFNYKNEGDAQKIFLKHLKGRRISPYVLCFFSDGEEIFLDLSPDESKYYLNSRVSYFDKKNQLIKNKQTKNKIQEIKNKIL